MTVYAHLDDGHVLDAAERIGCLLADMMVEDRSLNSNTIALHTGSLRTAGH